MLNCLLTGGNGFLGNFIEQEISKKYNVFNLSRSYGQYKISLNSSSLEFKHDFDLVIHSAGKAHFKPKTIDENRLFFDVNVNGTANLLNALENRSLPKKFLFISSVAVYGRSQGQLINEDYPLLAKDSYGLSKIQAEKLIIDWCKKNNIICTILRLPLLVGENPPGNLGNMIKGIKFGYYFNIAGGIAKKSMVLAEDVANIIFRASEIGGIYNLTDGMHPSFYELSKAIGAKYGRSKKIVNLPISIAKILAFIGDLLGNRFPLNSSSFKKIISDLTFDDSKAKKVLSWKPKKVIEW